MCRLTMDPDNKKIALLKGKYGTVSGTLTAHKSYRIAADPLVAYFLFGIFQGFPTDYMPSNSSYFNWSCFLQYRATLGHPVDVLGA